MTDKQNKINAFHEALSELNFKKATTNEPYMIPISESIAFDVAHFLESELLYLEKN